MSCLIVLGLGTIWLVAELAKAPLIENYDDDNTGL